MDSYILNFLWMEIPFLSSLWIQQHFMWFSLFFWRLNQLIEAFTFPFFTTSVRSCLCSSSCVWKYRSDYIVHQQLECPHQPAGLMFDRIIRKLSTPVITEAHLLGFQRPASEADGKVTCCLCVGVWVILRRKNIFWDWMGVNVNSGTF